MVFANDLNNNKNIFFFVCPSHQSLTQTHGPSPFYQLTHIFFHHFTAMWWQWTSHRALELEYDNEEHKKKLTQKSLSPLMPALLQRTQWKLFFPRLTTFTIQFGELLSELFENSNVCIVCFIIEKNALSLKNFTAPCTLNGVNEMILDEICLSFFLDGINQDLNYPNQRSFDLLEVRRPALDNNPVSQTNKILYYRILSCVCVPIKGKHTKPTLESRAKVPHNNKKTKFIQFEPLTNCTGSH